MMIIIAFDMEHRSVFHVKSSSSKSSKTFIYRLPQLRVEYIYIYIFKLYSSQRKFLCQRLFKNTNNIRKTIE